MTASTSDAWLALEEAPRSTARPRARDERLRVLVNDHFQFVWRSLRGLGVLSANVDDGVQQVFLIASQKLDSIVEGSEAAFLYATARGVAANIRRAVVRRRECTNETAMAMCADDAPSPEQVASSNQARALLERAMESMDEDERAIFVLYELEGLTMAAIAKTLELPAGTVASRLRRARETFRTACNALQSER